MKIYVMQIYITQHLPVENNDKGLVTGLVDQPVSKAGKLLTGLKKSLLSLHFDAVLCSPLIRSIQTIEMCFGKGMIDMIVDKRLLPVDYGEWHDRKKTDVAKVSHLFIDSPFPAGESISSMANRHRDFFQDLKSNHIGKVFLLIGHEGTEVIIKSLCYGDSLYQGIRESGERRVSLDESGHDHNANLMKPPSGPYIL